MNYYNPYMNFYSNPGMYSGRTGLLSGLFRNGFNWGSILSNTQRTLGIVNQAIPVIKQVSPVVKNAKTMFRVMSEFKKFDTPVSTPNKTSGTNTQNTKQTTDNTENTNQHTVNNGPTFFI